MLKISRRNVLQSLTAFASAVTGTKLFGINFAQASDAGAIEWRHGLSLFGDLKYPAGFDHFDYVKPDAPKGGRVRLYGIGTFDSLNPYTFRGNAAGFVGNTIDQFMSGAADEPSSEYGLVAEAVSHPEDFSRVIYRINENARFHDGEPIKPEDAIWSMEALTKSHPGYAYYYNNVVKSEQVGEREVGFSFSGPGNRELPQITGQLPILPKHWWQGKNADGEVRDINKTTLEPLLGSGPYRITDVDRGRSITLKRDDTYWAKDLPVNIGKYNFDEIQLLYFRDDNVAHEAFKGDQYDWRSETSSKIWATGYDFPAVKRQDVVIEEIETKNGTGMQCYAFNLRRDKFTDPRVRQAFNYAFDFEWANENLFYGQYRRTNSFFENSELAATGLPDAAELKFLEPLKGKIPPEVFTKAPFNPITGSPQNKRQNLREAFQLLKAAGWTPGDDRILRNEKGDIFEIEFLLVSPLFERIVLPYTNELKKLGVKTSVRTVDPAQYERRLERFEYDIIVTNWGQSLSPGNEQRNYWGSASASRDGSRNYVGINDPSVDKLIDAVIFAKDRAELVAATRALDRVLLWNHYVVPMWHIPYQRTARWNRFGKPSRIPEYSIGFPHIWWHDAEAAGRIKRNT